MFSFHGQLNRCKTNAGTPPSLIFAQEPDLNQLHVLKDCSNHALGHELVPIVTMSEQQQVMPEVLDNLPPPPPMQLQMTSMQQPIQQSTMSQPMGSSLLTGVYTLTEETELEVEENTSM